MKKVTICLMLVLFGSLIFYHPVANAMDGENLFKTKCGQCHKTNGEAPVFSPVKYASSQWERFFVREKHKRKKDISGQISGNELASIKQFLIDHAADSDLPIAAGLK